MTGKYWIRLHPAGTDDSTYISKIPIPTTANSGSLVVRAPTISGRCDFLLFRDGIKVATSDTFDVNNPSAPLLAVATTLAPTINVIPTSIVVSISATPTLGKMQSPVPSAGWQDNFKSYALGSWPSPWIPDGDATDFTDNYIDGTVSSEGSRSFHLYGIVGGCWAAIANHPLLISAPFTISVDVRNGTENLSGCHPQRGEFGIQNGPSWTNYSERAFVSFFLP